MTNERFHRRLPYVFVGPLYGMQGNRWACLLIQYDVFFSIDKPSIFLNSIR
jgi:hypothetical protein